MIEGKGCLIRRDLESRVPPVVIRGSDSGFGLESAESPQ